MKYKYALSSSQRYKDQYKGFSNTIAPRFWRDKHIDQFPFPVSDKPVHNLSVPKNTVLGKRAEAFFAAMILHSSKYRLLASQIQLISAGVTQGEIDFVVEEVTCKKVIHIELAYKFYLLDPRVSNELAKWVGPNKRDTLERKWMKLLNHQFPKISSSAAVHVLRDHEWANQPIHQSLCMPMQLFLPFGESKSAMGELAGSYAGRWISFSDFCRELWNENRFFIPEKEDWFVNPVNCEIWFSKAEIMPALEKHTRSLRSPMVWVKFKEALPTRMFITFW